MAELIISGAERGVKALSAIAVFVAGAFALYVIVSVFVGMIELIGGEDNDDMEHD